MHPEAYEQENRHCRNQFAGQVRVQQRFDVLWVPVIGFGEVTAHLPRPNRHQQKSQWRIVQAIIILVCFAFHPVIECKIAADECRPGISRGFIVIIDELPPMFRCPSKRR
jgi:hypothetical protein